MRVTDDDVAVIDAIDEKLFKGHPNNFSIDENPNRIRSTLSMDTNSLSERSKAREALMMKPRKRSVR